MMKLFTRGHLLIFTVCLAGVAAYSKISIPNDPFFHEQWALHNDGSQIVVLRKDNYHSDEQQGRAGVDVGWLEARDEIQKLAKAPVTVAVIDTGVDIHHPDLQGRIRSDGFDFLPAEVPVWGLQMQPVMSDAQGHGTQVAGIIAANSDNSIGIAGLTPPTVKILPLRVFNLANDYVFFRYRHRVRQAEKVEVYNDQGTKIVQTYTVQPGQVIQGGLITDYVANAVHYAIAHHADIINLSLDWPAVVELPKIRQALDDATKAGILIVTAPGNDRKNAIEYPCDLDGVICVGAVTNTGKLAYYSNFGGNVDVLAPGDGVLSTFPTGLMSLAYRVQGYELFSGTSAATPFVSGLAAILKSIYPNISLNELRARIFLSTTNPPKIGRLSTSPTVADEPASLYVLINIQRAIEVRPQPVFYPHFKSLNTLPLNEQSLRVRSHLRVENLWSTARDVRAQLYVNGRLAGESSISSMKSGALLVIPWSYQLSSLDDSDRLHLDLHVSAQNSRNIIFEDDITVARRMANVAAQKRWVVPSRIRAADWLVRENGTDSTTMTRVPVYGFSSGLPKYFRVIKAATAPIVEIYDPSRPGDQSVKDLAMAGLRSVQQVFQIDLDNSGKLDWAIVGGYATDSQHVYMQFRFFDPQFKPLWGDAANSTWQVHLQGIIGAMIWNFRYVSPGSWVRSGNRLIPCFMASGPLPESENFDSQDSRYSQQMNHIYYLQVSDSNNGQYVPLTVHALDDAKFRDKQDQNFAFLGWIPPEESDMLAGHLRALVSIGQGWGAQTLVVDIPFLSVAQNWVPQESAGISGWNQLVSLGERYYLQSPNHGGSESGFLNFDDNERGVFNWVKSDGEPAGQTEFSFHSPENPIVQPGLLALFSLSQSGRVWFVESQFNLIAFHQSVDMPHAVQSGMISINRDSNFSSVQQAQQFVPVIVGSNLNPEPGLYTDLSLMVDHYVDIATWNLGHGQLERTARYSLLVPSHCAQMLPVQVGADVNTLSIPMFCESKTGLSFDLVQPGG